jgi:hypothetical protein
MSGLVPNRFLFDLEFPLRYRAEPPTITGDLHDWTHEELLPLLGDLDDRPDFAAVWACWSEKGIAVACRVTGKWHPLKCDPQRFWTGDNLRLCTDMRDARTNRRATRFCQHLYLLPTGGGARRNQPVAGVHPMRGAVEDAPSVPVERIQIAASIRPHDYAMEAFIPSDCLVGFDPVEHPRIGMYYILEDGDHGQQYLTVGDDLNWFMDPSTWATAVLVRPAPKGP